MASSCVLGCVLLAAGNSTRFHANKLLAQFGSKPVYLHSFLAVPRFLFHRVTVVTQYDAIQNSAAELGYECVINPSPERGISSSLRLGLEANLDCDAVMFMVCDQPLLRSETIVRMIDAWKAHPDRIIGTEHNGTPGNPNLFPSCYFQELMHLEGDKGGAVVLRNHPDSVLRVAVDAEEQMDVDTASQLASLLTDRKRHNGG